MYMLCPCRVFVSGACVKSGECVRVTYVVPMQSIRQWCVKSGECVRVTYVVPMQSIRQWCVKSGECVRVTAHTGSAPVLTLHWDKVSTHMTSDICYCNTTNIQLLNASFSFESGRS